MSNEKRHRIQGDELRAALEKILAQRVKVLRRRLCAYSSSYTVENLDVTLARGKKLRLVLKDVSPPSVLATVQQVRPHFLYHPAREIEVYENMLQPGSHGTAKCLGTVNSPELERHWLFLERVEGRLLWQSGDLAHWDAAARWLGEFHSASNGAQALARFNARPSVAHEQAGPLSVRELKRRERRAPPMQAALRGGKTLLRYDEKFFGVWIERAEKFLKRRRAAELRSFGQLVKNYGRVVKRLAALPQTFIHGECYASNVIVRAGAAAGKICVIDWELAGVGPGALDLAALTAGEWNDAEKRRFVTAYREGLNSRRAPAVG